MIAYGAVLLSTGYMEYVSIYTSPSLLLPTILLAYCRSEHKAIWEGIDLDRSYFEESFFAKENKPSNKNKVNKDWKDSLAETHKDSSFNSGSFRLDEDMLTEGLDNLTYNEDRILGE